MRAENSRNFTILVLLSIVVGIILPFQASINATLTAPLNNPAAPGFVNFTCGALFLGILFLYDPRLAEEEETQNAVMGHVKKNTRQLASTAPWYLLLCPGFIGSYYIYCSFLLGSKLGFSLFFVCVIAGQLIGAALIDHVGFLNARVIKLTAFKVITLGLVIVGCLLSAIEKVLDSNSGLPIWKTLIFIILSISSGFMLALQVPLNQGLRSHMRTLPHRSTLWYYSVGAVIMLVGIYVTSLLGSVPAFSWYRFKGIEFWQYLGGPLGGIMVSMSVFVAPKIGLGLFSVISVGGQLLASLLIDSLGLIGSKRVDPTVLRVCGVGVVILGVIIYRFESLIMSKIHGTSKEDSQMPSSEIPELKTGAVIETPEIKSGDPDKTMQTGDESRDFNINAATVMAIA